MSVKAKTVAFTWARSFRLPPLARSLSLIMTELKLALLGGKPVRNRPFTAWPIFGKPEEKRLLRTLHSGKWGKLNGPEVA